MRRIIKFFSALWERTFVRRANQKGRRLIAGKPIRLPHQPHHSKTYWLFVLAGIVGVSVVVWVIYVNISRDSVPNPKMPESTTVEDEVQVSPQKNEPVSQENHLVEKPANDERTKWYISFANPKGLSSRPIIGIPNGTKIQRIGTEVEPLTYEVDEDELKGYIPSSPKIPWVKTGVLGQGNQETWHPLPAPLYQNKAEAQKKPVPL
jgi:hypothetical protein